MALSREEMGRRIMRLPPGERDAAIRAARQLYGGRLPDEAPPAASAERVRDPAHRRRYAGDPLAYLRDLFGYRLTPDQERALALIEREDRVLIPSANNVGKSWLLAAYALYRFDAVASLPAEDLGLEEQGAQILLPGPDHSTIYSTIYSAILEHANRAERRGFPMPGRRSENSVLWRVRPRWFFEPFSPDVRVGQEVSHAASGRHHRNQLAIIEEGQGVPEPVWSATEGMCSGDGNKIVSAFNPTEPIGPAYKRAKGQGYTVFAMSALRHPNVVRRDAELPDAISYKVVDARVANECRDMGRAQETIPDATEMDFVYALPPRDATERGGREDGIPGHPAGEPRVYRPGPRFTAQVLGQWPRSTRSSLFSARALEEAMDRWDADRARAPMPDCVGLDPAREGIDTSTYLPRWGRDAEELLRAYAEAVKQGPAAVETIRRERRQYLGEFVTAPSGDGPSVALHVMQRFALSTFAIDEGGVGASVLDHMVRVLGARATGVSFSAAPLPPTPGETYSENFRTMLYVRAALLVAAGLVDVPPDVRLREELLAHETSPRARVVTVMDSSGMERKERKESVLLIEKDEIKKRIGRSPDRADAFVLAVNGDPLPRRKSIQAW
ncbi:MAG: hypothetical protein ABS52_19510 [Gemmatimonadetes bacterium SCN 70-22]|nr:MAG: hypothetical protein ABS52_19510 [Gemmatimonadetes bacterium SCN 70-22]